MGETGDKGATKAVAVKQRQYVCVVGRRWLMSLRSAAGRRQATPLPQMACLGETCWRHGCRDPGSAPGEKAPQVSRSSEIGALAMDLGAIHGRSPLRAAFLLWPCC